MSSIKAFSTALSPYLSLTPNALYERQRALVRAGLLSTKPGRGPGSGVEASPKNVALLILSTMATDQIADYSERAAEVVRLRQFGPPSKWTKARNPVEALAELLASPAQANRMSVLLCNRNPLSFTFVFGQDGASGGGMVTFENSPQSTSSVRLLRSFVELDRTAVIEVAELLSGERQPRERKGHHHG